MLTSLSDRCHISADLSGTQRHLHTIDRVIFCWFALTGIIHFVVEGVAADSCVLLLMITCKQSQLTLCAGSVVVFADFYKSESSNILFEICKLLRLNSMASMPVPLLLCPSLQSSHMK